MYNPKFILFIFSLFIVSLPLTNRDIFRLFNKDFLIPVRVLDLLFGVYGLYVGLKLLWQGKRYVIKNYFLALKNDKFFVLLGALLLVRLLSFVNSKNIFASLNLLTFYFFMIIVYLFLKKVIEKNPGLGFWLYNFYIGVVSLTAVYSLVQVLFFFVTKDRLPGLLVGGNYFRVPSTFYDANHFPAFLTTGFFFVLALSFSLKNNWLKSFLVFITLLISASIFVSFSRSGILGFTLGFILMCVFIARYKLWRKFIPIVLLLVAVFLALLVSDRLNVSLVDRVFSSFNSAEKSTTAHRLLIGGGFDLFSKHPLLGVGYGSFSEAFRETEIGKHHLTIDPNPHIRLPAHSVWLEILTETGVLGFSLFCGIVYLLVGKLKEGFAVARNKREKLYLAALASGLAGLLAGGLFYSYNLEFFWFYLFFVYLFSSKINTLKENKQFNSLEASEKINWSEILPPVFIGLYVGVIIFWQLGKNALIDWDEAIYAQISKTMVLSENFLEPYWSGHIWFDKPPLYMWLSAFIMRLEEFNNFAPRFWSAIFGVGGIVVTYLMTRLIYDRLTAILASIILASSFHYLYYSRNGMLDVAVTFFMVVTLYLVYLGRRYPLTLVLAGLSLGLGFMTKNVVSFLILPSILTLFILNPGKLKIFSWHSLLMVLAFLLVTSPWHLYMYLNHGTKFLDSYLGYHIIGRATTNVEGKGAPPWVYLAVIRNSLRIWFPVLVVSSFWALKRIFSHDKNLLFLGVWALSIILAFSFSTTKLIWYIIPIYPPLAIITARFVFVTIRKLEGWVKFAHFSKLAVLIIFLITFAYTLYKWEMVQPEDFNGDVVSLIKREEDDDYSNNHRTLLIIEDFGTPVALYYNNAAYKVVSKSEFPSVFTAERPFYLIAYIQDFEEHQALLNWDVCKEIARKNNRVLVKAEDDLIARVSGAKNYDGPICRRP